MTEQEQQALTHLENIHTGGLQMGLKEEEILKIAKTAGNVPWAAMTAYCDAHNSPYPDWPDMVKF